MSVDTESLPSSDRPRRHAGGRLGARDGGPPSQPRSWSSISLTILTALALIYSAYFARAVLLPVVMAFVLTLLLRPIVRRFYRYRVPDAISAAIVLFVLLLAVGSVAAYLAIPARDWVDRAPAYMQVVGQKLSVVRDHLHGFSEVSEKVREMTEATDEDEEEEEEEVGEGGEERSMIAEAISKLRDDPDARIEREKPIPVEIRQPQLWTGVAFLSTTGGLIGGVIVTIVLCYFLLTAGDRFLNHTLEMLPTFRERRNVVEVIYEVERGVSAYLSTITLINVGLGFAIGLAMWGLGVPNAVLWGAMACVLNFVPYLGALTGTVVVFLVAVYHFDSLAYALLVPGAYLSITAMEGNFVTPALLGRQMSLNPIVVFLSLIFWGWIWGVGGVLLAVPMLAMVKVSLEKFERTRPISVLLGG